MVPGCQTESHPGFFDTAGDALGGQFGDTRDWTTRVWVPGAPEVPMLQDRFEWKVNVAYDFANNRVNAAMDASAKWEWRYLADNPLTVNFLEGGPPPPPGAPTSDSLFIGGGHGIDSDGLFDYDPPGVIPPWEPSWAPPLFDFDLF